MINKNQLERQEMLNSLTQLSTQLQDENQIKSLAKIKNFITEKRYGLVWEEHSEQVETMLVDNVPVFIEKPEKTITANKNQNYNFLLEGDNLHSLLLLQKTHKEKIDVIYIDPPYNTGNKNFIYNDNYVDATDSYPHSKWLSFMNERLVLARNLLSSNGVIFISIDDNELAQLKLLCDDVFGEPNYINTVIVKTKNAAGASGGGEARRLKKNVEYLLIYCKSIISFENFKPVYQEIEISKLLAQYKANSISWKYTSVLVNRGDKEYICSTTDAAGEEIKIYKRNNFQFSSISQLCKQENLSVKEIYDKYFYDIHMTAMPQSSIRGRFIESIGVANLSKDSLYSIEYTPKSGRNKGKLYEQFYKGEKARLIAWFSDVAIKNNGEVFKKDIEGTLWTGIEWNNLNKEGYVSFDNGKKPLNLIKRILKIVNRTDITVLDFFAGSGTTGHAVAQLNQEDGGNRTYILCTNNENNICEEITYQRLHKIQAELPHNLKYFKTAFIPYQSTEPNLIESTITYAKELIELENHRPVDGVNIGLLECTEDFDAVVTNLVPNSLLYVAQDLLLSNEQKYQLSNKNIQVINIPSHFYSKELVKAHEM